LSLEYPARYRYRMPYKLSHVTISKNMRQYRLSYLQSDGGEGVT
jgi:hypothetical protein